MSIGFLSGGASSKTVDVFSGSAGTQIETSLQSVLSKYDSIRTDLDRLIDAARLNTFDITSRQHYNTYLKESVNGWSETWYSEYRAVLALRVDSLQKKLQAAYNRVLERSAYAEMKANQESVFAPYANRTFSNTEVNYKVPASTTLFKDVNADDSYTIPTFPAPTNPPPGLLPGANAGNIVERVVNEGIPASGSSPAVAPVGGNMAPNSYDNNVSGPEDNIVSSAFHNQATINAVRDAAMAKGVDTNDLEKMQQLAVAGADAANRVLSSNGLDPDSIPPYDSGLSVKSPIIPPPPGTPYVGVPGDPTYAPGAQNPPGVPIPPGTFITPPTPPPYGGGTNYGGPTGTPYPDYYYISQSDVNFSGSFPNRDYYGRTIEGIAPQYIDRSSPNWGDLTGLYSSVRQVVEVVAGVLADPGGQAGTNAGTNNNSTSAPPTPPSPSAYQDTYSSDANIGKPKLFIPMFGAGDDKQIDLSTIVPSDVYDTLMGNPGMVEAFNASMNDLKNSFVGRQYDEIIKGNEYKAEYMNVSLAVYPGPLTIYTAIDSGFSEAIGGSLIQGGAQSLIGSVGGGLFSLGIGPDLHYGTMSAISGLGGNSPLGLPLPGFSGFPPFPTIGLTGMLLTIPIPYVPITINVNVSYDLVNHIIRDFLHNIRPLIVETMQTQAYAASSGTAFDSYASRGEYHFSEPGLSEAIKKFSISLPFGASLDFGDAFDAIMFDGVGPVPGIIGNQVDGEYVNNAELKERLFNYKHSVQAAENRETESGAFFATNAFLSQFELNEMESTYWTGTQQNEEVVNADLARAVTTSGKEFLRLIASTMTAAAGSGSDSPVMNAVISMVMGAAADAEIARVMYDLMFKDVNETAKFINPITGGLIVKSKFDSEAYDYIENDHKPFEADSDFNYVPNKGPLSILSNIFNSGTPDFVLEGYANTKRFASLSGNTAQAARGEDVSLGLLATELNPFDSFGAGPRAYAGRTGAPGIWTDTAFDGSTSINEVYVGTRTVKFSDLSMGFGMFTASDLAEDAVQDVGDTAVITDAINSARRETSTDVTRFIGADSRVFGKRYDAADPSSLETFNTGLYTGTRAHYDRRNQYSMSFETKASGQTVNLFGAQALNPTLGGFIKMGEVDKNKADHILLAYDNGGMTGSGGVSSLTSAQYNSSQKLGGAADGSLNEMNEILYEAMHLRADGRNLSTIKEYRDVFQMGLAKNMFISGQSYHSSGGGITSSIEVRFDNNSGRNSIQSGTREDYNSASYDPYNTMFLTKSKGKATIYLNSYFAHKKRAADKKT